MTGPAAHNLAVRINMYRDRMVADAWLGIERYIAGPDYADLYHRNFPMAGPTLCSFIRGKIAAIETKFGGLE
jgi:hypothetical protein